MMRTVRAVAVLFVIVATLATTVSAQNAEAPVRQVVEQFETALEQRDLARIEPLMAADMVAFENGHRNDTWADFRDHHLVPEMKEPAPPMKREFVRVSVAPKTAWAYTKAEMTLTRKSGEKAQAILWSVYILEKRSGQWKIVMLDWSMRVQAPPKPE